MPKNRGFVVAAVAFLAVTGVILAVLTFKASPPQDEISAMLVRDAYLRSSTATSTSAAAFLELTNQTGQDDRLIGARADLGGMVQLHSHTQDANGVMRMGEIEGGVPLASGETHIFKRGGDHLMFMGLSAPLEQGQIVPVTLIFERAGEIRITVPVDQERKADHGAAGN